MPEHLVSVRPDATPARIEEAGHYPQIESPDACCRVSPDSTADVDDAHLAANRANWDDRVAIHVALTSTTSKAGARSPASGRRNCWATSRGFASCTCSHFVTPQGLSQRRSPASIRSAAIERSRAGEASGSRGLPRSCAPTSTKAIDAFDAAPATVPSTSSTPAWRCAGCRCRAVGLQAAGYRRWAAGLFIHDGHPLRGHGGGVDWRSRAPTEEPTHGTTSTSLHTDGDGCLIHRRAYEWNHSIGEIVTALLANGLKVDHTTEHD